MATQRQIDETYNYMDEVWRLCLGEHADISGAMYDGNFKLSLEEAQHRKHEFIFHETRLPAGGSLLDVGCGWGALLDAARRRGARGVGLTLSSKQQAHCARSGLDARLRDWKDATRSELGVFDAVASLGAFEHFCSDTEFVAGKQDEIYGRYFSLCHSVLPDGGRMYLQTMTFNDRVPDPEVVSVHAPPDSDARVLGLVRKFYPGSWAPAGLAQIERTAAPWFRLVSVSSGRTDYIETIDQWNMRLARRSIRKAIAMLRAATHFLRDPDFRWKLEASRRNSNQECFRRGLMDHLRIVMERR